MEYNERFLDALNTYWRFQMDMSFGCTIIFIVFMSSACLLLLSERDACSLTSMSGSDFITVAFAITATIGPLAFWVPAFMAWWSSNNTYKLLLERKLTEGARKVIGD
jgi:hypothetical protein